MVASDNLGQQWVSLHRGLVLGVGEFEDRHVDRYVDTNKLDGYWTPDAEVAKRYAGRGAETGVVLHAQAPASAVSVRRNGPHTEAWLPPKTDVRLLGRTLVRPADRGE